MYRINAVSGNLIIKNLENFDLAQTLDCGQAFRWKSDDGVKWQGVAHGRLMTLYKNGAGDLIIENTGIDEFNKIWKSYFDFDRDYAKIITEIGADPILKKAAEYSGGIRILNQDPWETLCSFIISQNNNIPRIKGIIDRLCENFGEKREGFFTFPTADIIAKCSLDELEVLRSGFRAKYILDAAKKVSSGEVDLNALKAMPLDEAREHLMKIKGVGPKVADCVLLFSLCHIDAFPRDVWINRTMQVLFNNEFPPAAAQYAGIAQQYLFYYARSTKLEDIK